MKEPQYENLSDDALFLLVRDSDDRDAFRMLYARYGRRLYSYCLRVMGDREEAQDVFQIAMANLYEKRALFSEGNFAGWLMTIVKNQCLMAKRRLKKEPAEKVEISAVADSISGYSEHVGTDVFANDVLRAAIGRLSAEFREVIELRYFDDFSISQIASIAGISESLAKVRLMRARKKLLVMMSPYREELV